MIKKKQRTRIKDWLKATLIALLVIWFFKLFFLQTISISDSNMENTLFSGDKILVNKVKYGIKLPETLLSFPILNEKIPFTSVNSYINWITLPYIRFFRFFEVKRNEVIVFNLPLEDDVPKDKKTKVAKRCVGLPGDTIMIINKKVFVNNKMLRSGENLKFKFRIVTNGKEIPKEIIECYNLRRGGQTADGIYDYFMSSSTVDSIIKNTTFKNIKMLGIYKGDKNYLVFPHNPDYGWNDDYYGPMVIPKKGVKINLTLKNAPLYRRIIEKYEGNTFEIKGQSILINNAIAIDYVFNLNYYFVLDDDRDNSYDSRQWGFLPEDHIIGSASFVWFSVDRNENAKSHFRRGRILKNIE